MKFRNDLTQDELKRILSYDAETGHFHFRMTRGGNIAGSRAGTVCSQGYRSISVKGHLYKEHRLAWLYIYGQWPRGLIDHIDRQPSNNRIGNLREATSQQNQFNCRRKNKTGFKGVCSDGKGKFFASAKIGSRRFHLGTYETAAEAAVAYQNFAADNHGQYHRVSETSHIGAANAGR